MCPIRYLATLIGIVLAMSWIGSGQSVAAVCDPTSNYVHTVGQVEILPSSTEVFALQSWDGQLFAGGNFTSIDQVSVAHIAQWDGTSWSVVGSSSGVGPQNPADFVFALSAHQGSLYVGGDFSLIGTDTDCSDGSSDSVRNIARWNGFSWSPLIQAKGNLCQSVGPIGPVRALLEHDFGSGDTLFVGGDFGGIKLPNSDPNGAVVKTFFWGSVVGWRGSFFFRVGWELRLGNGSTTGGSVPGKVHALAVYDDGNGEKLYVAGQFNRAYNCERADPSCTSFVEVRNIAALDMQTGLWSSVGGAYINNTNGGDILSLQVYDDGSGSQLYAGGVIDEITNCRAGIIACSPGTIDASCCPVWKRKFVNGIARFDGMRWQPIGGPALGNGTTSFGFVNSLSLYNTGSGPTLIAGGEFLKVKSSEYDSTSTPANSIAQFDASGWRPLSGGGVLNESNGVTHVHATISHALPAQSPLLYIGGRFDQTGMVSVSPPPANLAVDKVVAWGHDPNKIDSDDDTFIDECDNCPAISNPDQSDRDGDGYGDVCDACADVANSSFSLDVDCNGIPDDCEPPASDGPTTITDTNGNVLWTLVYDAVCQGRLTKKYRGTDTDHIRAISYCYKVDGRLDRICEVDTQLTPGADADAACAACNRGQEMVYDPLYTKRLVGSRDFVSNCGCSSGATFTYRDALDRVEYITTADQSGVVRPYGVILEQFTYVANTDRVEDHFERQADGTLALVEHQTYTDNISTCSGGTTVFNGYEVLARKPIDAGQAQLRRACYDNANRLVETCTYDDLFAVDAVDTGAAMPNIVKYQYSFTQANDAITSERRETVYPSGYKDVREWSVTTGTIDAVGSEKTALTYRESVSGLRIDERSEVSLFDVALNRYRLDHTIDASGLQTFFEYDLNFPEATNRTRVDAPTGFSTYGQTITETRYDPVYSGRISSQEKLGPNGVVTTAFEYDTFGRLSKTIENATGLANEQIETRYIYNGFDDLVLSGRALEPGSEPKRQYVQATAYYREGTVQSELSCEWDGTLSLSAFDVTFPPCQLYQQKDYRYDSLHGKLIEESDIYGDQAPFDFYFFTSIAPRRLTHHLYDDTGWWKLATGVEVVSPPSAPVGDSFDWFEYDIQGRVRRTRHGKLASGFRPVSEITFNGRGLPATQIQTGEFTSQQLITTTLYNADGLVASIGQADGSYDVFEYDEFGRLVFQKRCDVIDCSGTFTIVTSQAYDAASRVTQTSVSDVSLTQTDYDNFDRPFRVRRRSNLVSPDDSVDAISLTQYNPDSSVARLAQKIGSDPSLIDENVDLVSINTFDDRGRLLQVRTTNNGFDEIVDYTYDFSGQRDSTRRRLTDLPDDATDLISRQTFNALGQRIQSIGPEGHYTSNLLDGFGRRVRSLTYQDGDGDGVGGSVVRQQRFAYFHHGGLASMGTKSDASALNSLSDSSDQVMDFGYDTGYRPANSTQYNTLTNTPLITSRERDSLGRPFSSIDPKANESTQSYGAATGQLVSANSVGMTVDDSDVESAALMSLTTYGYDGLGRKFQTTRRPATGVAIGDQSPLVTTVTFDDANRQRTVTDPDNMVTEFDYDLLGRLTNVREAVGTPLERSTTRTYDRLSRLTSLETSDAGQVQRTNYEYDRVGRRTRTVYPDSAAPVTDSVNNEYDRVGRLIRRTDQRDQVIEYSYDKNGSLRFKNVCDPGFTACTPSVQDEFTYDGMGRMTSAIRRAGLPLLEMSRVDFSYNDLSQLISETQTVIGLPSKTIFYTRDQLGNRMSLDCPSVLSDCLDYDYDALNRATLIDRVGLPLVSYVYEWTHQLKRRYTTLPSSTPITYDVDYDRFRRPYAHANVTNWPTGPNITEDIVSDFNKTGNPLASSRKISNAPAAGDIFAADLLHNYDVLRRLTSTDYTNTVGSNVGTQTYDLDIPGNRTTFTDTRKSPASVVDYGANNSANEYSDISLLYGTSGVLTYDANGNFTQDELGHQYDYDHDNHLIEVRDQTGLALATYTYDALGRRIMQDKDGATTIFYYDGQNILAEFDDTDTRLRYYVHGSTYVDELVLLHEDGPTDAEDKEFFYLPGPNYSVVGLADETGSVFEAYDYDSFGNVTKSHRTTTAAQDSLDYNQNLTLDLGDAEMFAAAFGASTGDADYDAIYDLDNDGIVALSDWQLWYEGYQDFQKSETSNPYYFTGRRLDFNLRDFSNRLTLSLYHYRARAYDARHGRFMQRDPAGYVDGLNLYEFARGRPLSLLDPWGLFTIQQIIGRYGEQALVRAIQSNPAKYAILHGLSKSVAANGPDLIVYNIKDEVFEFIDNKAWKRKSVSKLPVWMNKFDITKYENILQGAINAGKIPLKNVEAYKKALRAAGSGGKVRLAITPFGGKVRSIGSSLAKRGIQFLDKQAIRSGVRSSAARLCILPIAGAAFEVLSNTQTAFAAEIYDPEPEAVFVEDLQSIITNLVGGSTRYGSATKFHSNNELSSLRADLIQRGIIISRSALGQIFSSDGNSFEWSENLTEQDLDYLITKLKVDQRADSLDAAIEINGKSFEFSAKE